MGNCMRPERRHWGPAIDIRDAELVADVFRGLQDVVDGVSVMVTECGSPSEVISLGISVLGWRRLAAWLKSAEMDLDQAVANLDADGWFATDAERVQARELIESLRSHQEAWSAFVDPDEPDLLELVADL